MAVPRVTQEIADAIGDARPLEEIQREWDVADEKRAALKKYTVEKPNAK